MAIAPKFLLPGLLGCLLSACVYVRAGIGARDARCARVLGLLPDDDQRARVDAHSLLCQGLLRLRGGTSRATSQARAKAKYLAQKVGLQVDAHRRKSERKMRDQLVAMAQSPASKRQAEEERIESELSRIQDAPFDPPTDAASVAHAQQRSESLRSKYTPGQIVEIEDSEEWHRETEGDALFQTHSIEVFQDQVPIIRENNERHDEDIQDEYVETCDEWDNVRPDGKYWGDEEVPKLQWEQASRVSCPLLLCPAPWR